MSFTREQIESAVKSKGFAWFEGAKDYDLNLVGVRNMAAGKKVTNVFDDWLTCSYKIAGEWKFHTWKITTDPGKKAMIQYHNPNGVARVVPGQYRGLWAVGLHQGKYEALRQVKPIKVFRDKNKDMNFDETTIQEGIFGINCHRSSATGESTLVENWSEGCQVHSKISSFHEMMAIVNKAKEIHGNSFSYTLLLSTDIK